MKKIVYIVFLVATVFAQAQQIIPKEQQAQKYLDRDYKNKYFKDVNGHLNKFIGTWKWQDNPTNPTKVFEITFYFNENNNTNGYYEDLLTTSYTYHENGVEIYNTTNGVYGGLFSFPNNLNKLRMLYMEPDPATFGFRYSFHIEYLPNSTTPLIQQLKWDVEIIAEVAEDAALPKIPRHIILTKQ